MMAFGSGMLTSTTSCAALGVTSSLIEKVRALPEKELTIFIFRDDLDINPESVNFRVFTVDTFRIEKRKKKQVFEQMKATISP